MSYFDDEPPRHLDIGSLTKGENFSIKKIFYNKYNS